MKQDNLKKYEFALLLAGILGGATSVVALPISINGDISFTGSYTVDNPNLSLATKFTSFTGVTVIAPNGAYAGTDGTPVTFTAPFVFAPPAVPMQLWTFSYGGSTYSLDATTLTVDFKNSNILAIEGDGITHITGYADTLGYWNITANKARASFSFSSSASAVPEPSSFLLVGIGLSPFALWLRRRS